MKTLAILSQKGGAGKTTLTLHLAIAAEQAGHAVLIMDIDNQPSASQWARLREADTPVVISSKAVHLASDLETARQNGADLAIIDTAPHASQDALNAARAADLILIPCRPSMLDLHAIAASVDIAALARVPAALVLNAVPPRGTLADEARSVLEQYKIPVSPVTLVHRAAYVHSLTEGKTAQEYEPDGKAAQEANALYDWIVSLQTAQPENLSTIKL